MRVRKPSTLAVAFIVFSFGMVVTATAAITVAGWFLQQDSWLWILHLPLSFGVLVVGGKLTVIAAHAVEYTGTEKTNRGEAE